jgi:lipopolysaccharide/colanic/teichoic acid biosynthesis glycosyltransferase
MEKGAYQRWGKRTFDLIAVAIGLLVLTPILLLCALLVRLTSRGPIFFRQTRVGLGGSTFEVFKFRTMRQGSDLLGPAVVIPGDQRLTLAGRLLRRAKLDELPQLINVLLGEMSLVGPRPRVPEEVDLVNPEEQTLLSIRPGLTSYASVYHRMEADYCARDDNPQAVHREVILPQKGYLDSEYVKNLSFALDLKLIMLTILLVFIPGKAEPRDVRFFGLGISPYGRAGQILLESLIFAGAVWLAYWLRYENQIEEFHRWQRNAFVLLLPAMRLATNHIMGIYSMIWRYVNMVDAAMLALSLSVVSAILLILRVFLPTEINTAHVFQLPLSVIAMEYLLVMGACLGARGLRRTLYEMDHRYQPLPTEQKRRILILGAGLSGLGVALEVGRYPHMELVGFVDDDVTKKGRLIAGYSVLGSSDQLRDLMRQHEITDLIVSANSVSSDHLENITGQCRALRVGIHVIPTIDQILGTGAVEVSGSSVGN